MDKFGMGWMLGVSCSGHGECKLPIRDLKCGVSNTDCSFK